jgi:hypothetical protein
MADFDLFPGIDGPAAPVSFSGDFLAGVLWQVTQGGMWLAGYRIWVPPGGDTVSRPFATWNVTGDGTAVLVSALTVAASGELAEGWNEVLLAVPAQVAIGTTYNSCTGWVAENGFPDSDTGNDPPNSFGAGGFSAGITSGPLFAFSDITGGTAPEPHGNVQGVFSAVLGSDPTAQVPFQGSDSGNFWISPIVSTTAPAGFTGPYRLWPNKADTNTATVPDLAVNYVVATEVILASACVLEEIAYFSPDGTGQLATACSMWAVTGPGSGLLAAADLSPAWSGAASSGWVTCAFGGIRLPAGRYKVSVFNDAAVPDEWSAKDAESDYWGTGAGGAGIVNGPLAAPGLADASAAYVFDGAGAGNSPPFSDGSGTTEPGQCTFAQPTDAPGGNVFPYLYVDGLAQNYWVDLAVSLAPAPGGGGRALGGSGDGRSAFRRRLIW